MTSENVTEMMWGGGGGGKGVVQGGDVTVLTGALSLPSVKSRRLSLELRFF